MGDLRCYRDPCPSHLFLPIHGVFKRSDDKAVCSIASIPVPNAVLDDPDSPSPVSSRPEHPPVVSRTSP